VENIIYIYDIGGNNSYVQISVNKRCVSCCKIKQ